MTLTKPRYFYDLLFDVIDITYYVSPAGSDTNDGLTVGSPFLTIQKAFDTIEAYSPRYINNKFTVEIAAGTYVHTTAATLADVLTTERIVIKGPAVGHPNVPTAIIDGTGGASGDHGMRVSGVGTRYQIENLKFQNFVGANGRIGLVGENEADIYTINIHAENCDWTGILAFGTLHSRIEGGILNNCRSGFVNNSTGVCTFGWNASSLATGPIVTNCTQSGVYWSRGSQGHCDYATFEDNATGLHVDSNSRVHTVTNDFNRNTIAIKTAAGGFYFDAGTNTFGSGADTNTTPLELHSFSGNYDELQDSYSEHRVTFDRNTINHSGLGLTVLATPYTLPADRLIGGGRSMRIRVTGVFTIASVGSTMAIGVGGVDLTLLPFGLPISGATFIMELEVHEVQGGYRGFGVLLLGEGSQRLGNVSLSGLDFELDQDVTVSADLGGAGDSMIIYRTDVFLTA